MISVAGAVPRHQEKGGRIREVSVLGEHYDIDAFYLFASVLQTATKTYRVKTYTQ